MAVRLYSRFWLPGGKFGYHPVTAHLGAPREIALPRKKIRIVNEFWLNFFQIQNSLKNRLVIARYFPVSAVTRYLRAPQDFFLHTESETLVLLLRYTVGRITPIQEREVRASDFGPKANFWMNFPKNGSPLTPSHRALDFKWKDYCPMVFRFVLHCSFNTGILLVSMCYFHYLKNYVLLLI